MNERMSFRNKFKDFKSVIIEYLDLNEFRLNIQIDLYYEKLKQKVLNSANKFLN